MNDRTRGPGKRAIPSAWRVTGGRIANDEQLDGSAVSWSASRITALEDYLAAFRLTDESCASRAAILDDLLGNQFDKLPLPGGGNTATRWHALSAVAVCDLALAKLFESHADALAILSELGQNELAQRGTWAVWAAEPPHSRLAAYERDGKSLLLEGTKPWCSGASHVTHALVTAWHNDDPVLAAVELSQPNIEIDTSGWQAIGMRATGTASVRFAGARATQIGETGAYLNRAGFWQGGAGIAACWLGSAAAVATTLLEYVARSDEPHSCAHLGAVDSELASAAALLRATADWIDANPDADARCWALRARVAVDRASARVIGHVSRALGPAPMCTDASFARAIADLPVFVRQSHAERDEEALARALLEGRASRM